MRNKNVHSNVDSTTQKLAVEKRVLNVLNTKTALKLRLDEVQLFKDTELCQLLVSLKDISSEQSDTPANQYSLDYYSQLLINKIKDAVKNGKVLRFTHLETALIPLTSIGDILGIKEYANISTVSDYMASIGIKLDKAIKINQGFRLSSLEVELLSNTPKVSEYVDDFNREQAKEAEEAQATALKNESSNNASDETVLDNKEGELKQPVLDTDTETKNSDTSPSPKSEGEDTASQIDNVDVLVNKSDATTNKSDTLANETEVSETKVSIDESEASLSDKANIKTEHHEDVIGSVKTKTNESEVILSKPVATNSYKQEDEEKPDESPSQEKTATSLSGSKTSPVKSVTSNSSKEEINLLSDSALKDNAVAPKESIPPIKEVILEAQPEKDVVSWCVAQESDCEVCEWEFLIDRNKAERGHWTKNNPKIVKRYTNEEKAKKVALKYASGKAKVMTYKDTVKTLKEQISDLRFERAFKASLKI